ncbi:hypothetical protein [Pseudoalteromonas sp. MMG005]|uniref:hypothetical protein n=1 Tax=Pseudoalteromonas sp. MMG005 TaxID=2822682 RepID=UPI001B39F402|nr:hypothetical protein [Pseudoalteromonas sp. MMG005]MBQ4848261.1 hypothetical protein [Pseudoalteromonas sp. MMG005]
MFTRLITLISLLLLSFYSKSEEQKIIFLCETSYCELDESIQSYISLEGTSLLEDDSLFIMRDSGVEVNSQTYLEYLQNLQGRTTTNAFFMSTGKPENSTIDSALSCEYDRDYDCEAWNDYHKDKKPYILQLSNYLKNFQYYHIVTQDDIDTINAAKRIRYTFLVNALTAHPASRAVAYLKGAGSTFDNIIATIIVGGVIGEIFQGADKTKFKVGDKLTIKGGKIIAVTRDGKTFNMAQFNAGAAGAGSGRGDGTGNDGGSNGGVIVIIPPPTKSVCYRTFSNGQVIQVPCP